MLLVVRQHNTTTHMNTTTILLILFAIWLVVAVTWIAIRLLKKHGCQKYTLSLNTKQKYLSLVALALFVLSLLVVPWRVNAQLLGFPVFSQISYGLIWSPPSGGINQTLVGILSPQGGILFSWMLVEWIVLAVLYWLCLRAFNHSGSTNVKENA